MKCSLSVILVILGLFIIDQASGQSERKTSNVCKLDQDCPANAFCENHGDDGQCICNVGFFIVPKGRTRECVRISDYEELCYLNEQCHYKLSLDAECRNSQCLCKTDSHYVKRENACYKSSRIGEYCRLTNNCIGNSTSCQQGTCRCPYEAHPSQDLLMCLNNASLGEHCFSDDECIVENSRCASVCRCRTSHIISQSGQRCLEIAGTLYNDCMEDEQCRNIPYSYCSSNSSCSCRKNYHDIAYKCFASVNLNEICETDENCIVPSSVCINGRCLCNHGFKQTNERVCSSATYLQFSTIILIILPFLRTFVETF